jgi:hypothetical protein
MIAADVYPKQEGAILVSAGSKVKCEETSEVLTKPVCL